VREVAQDRAREATSAWVKSLPIEVKPEDF
jgi:hypothetical protein